jgi:hypothetical protein
MEYKDIFSKNTLDVLKGKSSDNLKQMLGNKSIMKAMMDSRQLLDSVMEIEKPYRKQLEQLAIKIVTEMYPIISDNDIEIQAQLMPDIKLSGGDIDPSKEPPSPLIDLDNSKRRIINSITQGGSLRGSFAFYLFMEHLDEINPNLISQYGDLLKNAYGIYDDDQTIAMMLAMLAQQKQMNGGEVDVAYNEEEDKFIIKAQALCFPILLQEIIKGLYEIISLEGFTSDSEKNKTIVKQVDKVSNEPEDIRYGKYIYDAINKLYTSQGYDDTRVREYFLTDLYRLSNSEFIEFIENLLQDKLTPDQQLWVKNTMKDIDKDIKKDDTGLDNLDENIKLTALLKEVLLEVSLDDIKSQFVDTNKISQKDFTEIVNAVGNKSAYATWLAKKVADKTIKGEDIYKYKNYFTIFDRRKKNYPSSDINSYKSAQDVSTFIKTSVEIANAEKADPSQQKGVTRSDKYKEFYMGSVDGFDVYELPKGRKDLYGASCELGSGTEWCTATGKTRKKFDDYISKGPLFIFIKPGSDEKYQFSYEGNQFMDKDDNPII